MYSPLGAYVAHKTRIRERLIAGVVGAALGLAGGAVVHLIAAAWS